MNKSTFPFLAPLGHAPNHKTGNARPENNCLSVSQLSTNTPCCRYRLQQPITHMHTKTLVQVGG